MESENQAQANEETDLRTGEESENHNEKKAEQAEELDEQPEETEELDEATEQAIADYSDKIAALDEQLETYRVDNIAAMKRAELKKAHYSDKQIDRYLSHVSGETADEIKASVFELMTEIPPVDPYGDPNAFNGAKAMPKPVDRLEVGRKAIKRVINKIRL